MSTATSVPVAGVRDVPVSVVVAGTSVRRAAIICARCGQLDDLEAQRCPCWALPHLRRVLCHARPPRMPDLADAPGETRAAIAMLHRDLALHADDDGRAQVDVDEIAWRLGFSPDLIGAAVEVLVTADALRRVEPGELELVDLAPGCTCASCRLGADCSCWGDPSWPTS